MGKCDRSSKRGKAGWSSKRGKRSWSSKTGKDGNIRCFNVVIPAIEVRKVN